MRVLQVVSSCIWLLVSALVAVGRPTISGINKRQQTTSSSSSAPPFKPVSSFAESTRYADGSGMMYGEINANLRWQASGVLAIGSCSNTVVGLGTCFRQYLNSTGMLQDPPTVAGTTTTSRTTTSLPASATSLSRTFTTTSSRATTSTSRATTAPSPTSLSRTSNSFSSTPKSLSRTTTTTFSRTATSSTRTTTPLSRRATSLSRTTTALSRTSTHTAAASTSTGGLLDFLSGVFHFNVAGLSLQEQAARDDENLDLYWQAFPEILGGLQKRATCGTATSFPPTSTTATTSSTPMPTAFVPPSPRQRIEFLSWPGADAGTSWTYTWTTYLTSGVKTSEHFFHLWQLFSRDPCVSGPIFTLSAYLDNIIVVDSLKRCSPTTTPCPSIPISSFWGRTIVHSIAVTYGANGSMSYTASDRLRPNVPLLSYKAVGQTGSASSLKFGLYRAAGSYIAEAEQFVGKYKAVRIS